MNNKSKDTQTTEAIIRPFTLQQYRKTYPIHQNRFSEIEVSIASPEDIGLWSSGEITRSETVNYKTGKPEKNGLFCQTIFGPVRSYSCSCGKFEKAQGSSSTKCDVCGVELTDKIIRRVRMGHIDLLTPVAHIWFFKIAGAKAIPTLLENTLIDVSKDGSGDFKVCSLKTNAIEQIIYYQSYILTDLGNLPPKLLKPFSIFQIYSQEIEQQMQLVLKKLKQWFEDPSKNVGDEKKRNRGINLLIEALSVFEDDNIPFNLGSNLDVIEEITKCKFEIGAIAIQEILKRIDLGHNIKEYKRKLARVKRNGKIPKELLNKINIFENFKKNNVKPEWMILTKIPVIPADLRPMVALEGGRYSTTSLNELYRKIIIRNDKIKRLKDNGAPKALIISSYRLLQEAVDTLIDNKKRTTPEQMKNAPKGNPAKSLADSLLGKKGRFRQNLLGKRVDFSGRSVITVGPQLKLYQCGLPKELALELYKPFIMTKLIEAGKRMTEDGTERKTIDYKGAERMIKMKDTQIWKYVHAALEERPVLLNRAPTLHRLGIQAFEPVLVDGRAIQLHPLATTAFNADFDGDQMAVHLPISKEAINEARSRMLGSTNILGPKDGEPIISPTQDMTLGLYYLTTERSKAHFKSLGVNVEEKEVLGEGKIFATQKDALVCHENDVIGLHALIGIRISGLRKKYLFTEEDQNKFLLTTVGKIIFNDILSDGLSFINDSTQNARFRSTHDIYDNVKELRDHLESHTTLKKPLTKKCVSTIIRDAFDIVQETIDAESKSFSERDERIKEHKLNSIMSKMLDHLKRLGFKYSTTSGISIAYSDVFVPEEKVKFIERANKLALQIDDYKALGQFSKTEYTKRIVNLWNKTKENLQRELVRKLEKQTRNPIFLMATSGARGNQSNFTQLMGMRGIMTNPQGEAIAIPVKSSFREGLTINEFFISTHGARKGNVDTAMKTGHSGYLTRIFIDSCQNVTVDSLDCGTKSTYTVKAITEKESPDSDKEVIIVPLKDRIFGRVAGKEIKKNGKIIVKKDELITRTIADAIISADIEEVEIWSILKGTGVSQKCYGLDLSTKKLIRPNTAVGVIAAQAIGEPGTQLTMNTFHTGGVADDADITQGLPIIEGIVKFQRVGARPVDKNEDVITKVPGTVQEIFDNINDSAWSNIVVSRKVPGKNDRPITYKVRKKSKILVKEGQELKAGQRLTEGYLQLYKIWKYAGIDAVYDAMMRAYHKVYRQQSISISDKYFEIVIKQMTNKLRIISPGQTKFLPGQFVEVRDFTNENARVIEKGRAPAFGRLWILTAIRSSLLSKSFLWSISFQETTQYLAKAVITGKKDPLQGLKENVIFGNLIPVGTGMIKNKEDFFFDNDAKNVNKY